MPLCFYAMILDDGCTGWPKVVASFFFLYRYLFSVAVFELEKGRSAAGAVVRKDAIVSNNVGLRHVMSCHAWTKDISIDGLATKLDYYRVGTYLLRTRHEWRRLISRV